MVLLRLIGQGRLCECLKSNPEMLAIDVFMREMGFRRGADREAAGITDRARELVEQHKHALTSEVEHALQRHQVRRKRREVSGEALLVANRRRWLDPHLAE